MISTPRLYLCFEPEQQALVERLSGWPLANGDAQAYAARMAIDVDAPAAEPVKAALRAQLAAADVVVVLIAQGTGRDLWIEWELSTARALSPRPGLVGVLPRAGVRHPAALADSGTIFVPFRRDLVERAIAWAVAEPRTRGDFTLVDE